MSIIGAVFDDVKDKSKVTGYVCKVDNQVWVIGNKESYEVLKKEAEEIKEPSEKELIELGKRYHPYYYKDREIANAVLNIQEIDDYEKKVGGK